MKRDFIAQNACDGAAVLSTRTDRFAGAKRKEKASVPSVRNDGWVVTDKESRLFGGTKGEEVLGAFDGILEAAE